MTYLNRAGSGDPRSPELRQHSGEITRRGTFSVLTAFALVLALPGQAIAQSQGSGTDRTSGGGESGGGHTGGSGGGESGGGHTGGSGGGESGGGHTGGSGGSGHGKTPGERAKQHRQRTGRVLGGGVSKGGHPGTGGEPPASGGIVTPPTDGSTSGPIGGGAGGEHFIHKGLGCWGADCKVLHAH